MRIHASALAVLVVPVALALSAGPAAADSTTAPATVTAAGNGVVFVTPDEANVTISASRAGSSAAAAERRDNAILRRILAGVLAAGLPRADVQVSALSLQRSATAARRGHKRVFRYVAAGTVTVNTMHVTLLSAVFAAATRAGADSYEGPDYSVSNPAIGELAAEHAAVLNAQQRAENAAEAVGMHVTGVVSINLDPSSPVTAPASSGDAKTPTPASSSTPLTQPPTNIGKQEVDASVDCVFTIG
jgi:uncharacterized protein YggE